MIASLGMYDRAETAASNDALWSAVRAELGYGPETLDRETDLMDIWKSPDLVLAQTCGMPYRTLLKDSVQLVGTPDYGLGGVPAGYYYSVFVVRAQDSAALCDYQDRTIAHNDPGSQSGWAAPTNHASSQGFQFKKPFFSGSHLASATAVANGKADIASIDAVSWRLIESYEACASKLKIIEVTQATPGLPYITALGQNAGAIFTAVEHAIDGLPKAHRAILGITSLSKIAPSAYLAVQTPPKP
ncbi:MAG: PhnD/SsuA/transferrin family substrate-binding protein [Paracoccaceae bacterium]